MGHWQPRSIERFVRGFPTSACTALVETDDGPGYLKAMGGPEGPHTLAAEVVATQLAAWFDLPTFDWCIMAVHDFNEIPFFDRAGNRTGQAHSGPAFVTRAEPGITWGGGVRELKRLANPHDISRLVVFDTWALNCDRHSPPDRDTPHRRKPNRDNVFLSEKAPEGQFLLTAMDHTHCFTCGREWTRKLSQVDKIRDRRIFGMFPEFRNFMSKAAVVQAAFRLNSITAEAVTEMVNHVPTDWDVGQSARNALVDLVVRRAAFVAETISTRLWPQGSLFHEDEQGDPEK